MIIITQKHSEISHFISKIQSFSHYILLPVTFWWACCIITVFAICHPRESGDPSYFFAK